MARKFYTIDDLYTFCRENKFESFSATKQGAPLIIQSIGVFESDDDLTDGLMPVKLKSCHTGKNRNKSGISDETMNLYKDSFKGRPILGAIYKTDTGEYEFRSHDMEIVEGEDGAEVNYIEQPIGFISETDEPFLEYDNDADKNYLMANGKIFADYSKAAEILERRRTCKCSVEIAVEEMSYNCAEDYLSIDKFRFCGVTILGYQQDGVTEIQEGMAGSKITIDDFSIKRNSMFSEDCQNKLIETLEKLNITLSSFNTNTTQKGGNEMKFEELLAKYGKTAEEVTFEIEGLSDEELEAKFAEAFDNDDNTGEGEGDNGEGDNTDNDDSGDGEGDDNSGSDGEGTGEGDNEPEKFTKTFTVELSHDDIRNALYTLIRQYENEDEYFYIREVFDSYFVMQDWWNNKIYKQNYAVDGENVNLDGDRIEVFEILVTKEEKDALDALKVDYAALEEKYNELVQFKANTEATELQAKKDSIFADEKYAKVSNTKAFKKLMDNSVNYSVEECVQKADEILDDFSTYAVNFVSTEEVNKPNVIGFSVETKNTKKKVKAYGKLFD